ncbi:MAG: heat-inducible transcriptional repressor HrcA [Bacillota bacterium]|nr:heat-inducible transcriptional repressor HrcA [Bacillota bacterium]
MSDRKKKILKAIIDDYIETAEPLGSLTVARRYLSDYSPATIRNEMADLEELGYLEKPHTSAGRVPSYTGYRLYVDMLMEKYRLTMSEMEDLSRRLEIKARELDGIVRKACSTVSALTDYTSFVITPQVSQLKFKNIKLIMIQEGLVLIVLVATGDMIKDRRIKAPLDITQEGLDRISGVITDLFCLKTANEIDFESVFFVEISKLWPELVPCLKEFLGEALSGSGGDVYLDGTANIFRYREYQDVGRAKSFMDFVDDEESLKNLVRKASQGETICEVIIGSETGRQDLKDCSMVLKSYSVSDDSKGSIGIIGPVRMDYARVMSTLEYIADAMDTIFRRMID